MDDFPALPPPHLLPPIRSQSDLEERWRLLMGPLGFGRRTLWMHFLDEDGHSLPLIVPVDDVPVAPPDQLRGIETMCRHLEAQGAASVVFLISGPGRRTGATQDDVRWARGLAEAVRRVGMRGWPVHRANDVELKVIAADDLAA